MGFGVNISFIQFGLRLLTVLKISIARTLNRCTSIVTVIIKGYSQVTFLDFLDFSDRFTSTKMPDQRPVVKICIKKLFTIATFSGFPIYFWSWLKAFSCIAALEHKFHMCWSNHRRSSIVIPSSFTNLVDSISLLSIASLYLTSLSFLSKKKAK